MRRERYGKDKAPDAAPKVGIMPDIIAATARHIGGINEIQHAHEHGGQRNEGQKDELQR